MHGKNELVISDAFIFDKFASADSIIMHPRFPDQRVAKTGDSTVAFHCILSNGVFCVDNTTDLGNLGTFGMQALTQTFCHRVTMRVPVVLMSSRNLTA